MTEEPKVPIGPPVVPHDVPPEVVADEQGLNHCHWEHDEANVDEVPEVVEDCPATIKLVVFIFIEARIALGEIINSDVPNGSVRVLSSIVVVRLVVTNYWVSQMTFNNWFTLHITQSCRLY